MGHSEDERLRGYVVGTSRSGTGNDYWVVRVKEPSNPHNGEKFDVVSTRGGITLARGLNVDFLLGTVDGPLGKKILKAVDVSLNQQSNSQKEVHNGPEHTRAR